MTELSLESIGHGNLSATQLTIDVGIIKRGVSDSDQYQSFYRIGTYVSDETIKLKKDLIEEIRGSGASEYQYGIKVYRGHSQLNDHIIRVDILTDEIKLSPANDNVNSDRTQCRNAAIEYDNIRNSNFIYQAKCNC